MTNSAGSGRSTQSSTGAAVAEALGQAREGLSGAPQVGFIFASPSHDLGVALREARRSFGGGTFLGCSTAGELTERGLTHGGVAVLLLRVPDSVLGVSYAGGMKGEVEQAGRALSESYGPARDSAFGKGMAASTTVLLVDGLCGIGEKLIWGVRSHTSSFQQIVGGAAGDEGRFKTTSVGLDERCDANGAVALHVFSRNMWALGVNHGLTSATHQMQVTRAKDNVVLEIDHRPAFEAYREFARGRGVELRPEEAVPFMINHELGIYFLDTVARARAPLSVGTDGSLTCAAGIPEGSMICLLDGEKANLVNAARLAAEEAKRNLEGRAACGILLFDCVCRGQLLGESFGDEIAAVRSVFPDVPVCGFLTYGEIARFKGKLDGWHNTTAVVAAIPAS